jgi:hypothetical protein
MVLYSTPESFQKSEFSWLALLETIVAVAAAIAVWVIVGNAWSLVIWSCIGWTLMLRTDLSTARGVYLFELFYAECLRLRKRALRTYRRRPSFRTIAFWLIEILSVVLLLTAFVIALLLGSLLIKVVSTVSVLITHPIRTLRAVPQNWLRSLICLDVAQPPELVPGYYEHIAAGKDARVRASRKLLHSETGFNPPRPDDVRYYLFRAELRSPWIAALMCAAIVATILLALFGFRLWMYWRGEEEAPSPGYWWVFGALAPFIFLFLFEGLVSTPLRLLLYIPTFLYRLSLKATAITYFPLLFTIQSTVSEVPIRQQYEDVLHSPFPVLKRKLSWFFGFLIVLKIVAYSFELKLGQLWRTSALRAWLLPLVGTDRPVVQYVRDTVAIDSLPGWQVATAANALISLGFFIFADRMLAYLRSDPRPGERLKQSELLLKIVLRFVTVVSFILSVYSIAANVNIIIHHEPIIRIPPFGRWWP